VGDDWNREFRQAADKLGVTLKTTAEEQLWRFWELLAYWNRSINLVSVTEAEEFFFRHIFDALTLVPVIPPQAETLIDLGSGAGLPGIPLVIVRPHLKVTLLEASRKRSSFLHEVIRQLRLSQVTVIHERIEALINNGDYGHYDCVTSRATWRLADFLRFGSPLLNRGGSLIAMKGNLSFAEWDEAERLLPQKGLKIVHDLSYHLPRERRERRILTFKYANNVK